MTANYRRRVFEEAENIALDKGLDRLQAREAAADHLRYAALRLIEGMSDNAVAERGHYMLTYGRDKSQADAWSDSVDWWAERNAEHAAERIRVVAVDADTITPTVAGIMDAIGGTFIYHETPDADAGPPLTGGAHAYHYLQRDHAPAVEDYCEWLRTRHYQQGREEAEMAAKAE